MDIEREKDFKSRDGQEKDTSLPEENQQQPELNPAMSDNEQRQWGVENLPETFQAVLETRQEEGLEARRRELGHVIVEKVLPLLTPNKEPLRQLLAELDSASALTNEELARVAAVKVQQLLKSNLTFEEYTQRREKIKQEQEAEKQQRDELRKKDDERRREESRYNDIIQPIKGIASPDKHHRVQRIDSITAILKEQKGRIAEALNDDRHYTAMLSALVTVADVREKAWQRLGGRSPVDALRAQGRSILFEHLERVEERLITECQNQSYDDTSLWALSVLLASPEKSQRDAAFAMWGRTKDLTNKLKSSGRWGNKFSPPLVSIMKNGSPEQAAIATTETIQCLGNQATFTMGSLVCNAIFQRQEHALANHRSTILEKVLGQYGLDSKNLIDAWQISGKKKEKVTLIKNNLLTIASLEHESPGIARVLMEEYGIKTFARYSQEVLREQYEQRNNTSLPYGIIVYPRDDHNGAFYDSSRRGFIGQLAKQLQGTHLVRIHEIGSKRDLARVLLANKKRYGQNHKISFAILGGHGKKDAIKFGRDDSIFLENKQTNLYAKDLKGKAAGRTSEFFEDNPIIVLNSCSTGTKGGIGQQLSATMGAVVIAPRVPVATSFIKVKKDETGKLHFEVTYYEGKVGASYVKGK